MQRLSNRQRETMTYRTATNHPNCVVCPICKGHNTKDNKRRVKRTAMGNIYCTDCGKLSKDRRLEV